MQVNGSAAAIRAGTAVSMNANRVIKWCIYALMAFPIVDYGLRLHLVHPLGLIWDKVVLIILAMIALVRYLSGIRPPWYRWQTFAVWFILFALGLMIAGAGDFIVSFQGFRDDVYYILFALLVPFVISPKDVIPLLHIGATVAILIAIHGIYQYITKAPVPANWGVTGRTRVYSVLQSPNELGSYMALMSPLMLGLAIYEQNRWRKWVYGVGTVLCLITLMFTFTRGAWVALAFALLVVSLIFERRLFIVLLVLAVVGYFLPPIHHRLAELLSPVYWIQSASSGRISRWLTAFQTMISNPLVGVGVGKYGGAVAANYSNGIYSDNYYAKTMGETGLIGLVLFMTMHVGLVFDLFKHAFRSVPGRARYVVIGGITGLIAMLIHNATENVFEFAPNTITYFMYATLLLAWGRGYAKEAAHEPVEAGQN